MKPASVAFAATLLSACVPVVVSSRTAAADTIRVPGDAETIQEGIDLAVDGDVVLIAAGVYTGPGNVDLDPRGKGITIRGEGGAAACIIDAEGASRAFEITNGEPDTLLIESLSVRNGFASLSAKRGPHGGGILVTDASATFRDCVFASCTTTDGNSGDAPTAGGDGGAFCVIRGTVRVEGCEFVDNRCGAGGESNSHEKDGGSGGRGGAVVCVESDVQMTGNRFEGNTAGSGGTSSQRYGTRGQGGAGGAVYVLNSTLTVSSSVFEGNAGGLGGGGERRTTSGGFGGAIATEGATLLMTRSSQFRSNHGGDGFDFVATYGAGGGNGGAVSMMEGGAYTAKACVFEGNRGGTGGLSESVGRGGHGGAIFSRGAAITGKRCRFSGNQAGDAGDDGLPRFTASGGSGGALHLDGASLILRRSFVTDNRAGFAGGGEEASWGADGGGVYVNGDAWLKKCDVSRNRATHGKKGYFSPGGRGGHGGGVIVTGTATITKSIIADNLAGNGDYSSYEDGGQGGCGGGVYAGRASMTSTVVSGNTAGTGGGVDEQIGGDGGRGGGVFAEGDLTMEDCLVADNIAGNGGGDTWVYYGGDAGNGGAGGGIWCGGRFTISATVVSGNRSGDAGIAYDAPRGGSGGSGGGAYAVGEVTARNVLFARNRTGVGSEGHQSGRDGDGGGLSALAGGTIEFCTFADNRAGDPDNAFEGGDGGGVALAAAGSISHGIFWGNDAASGIGEQIHGEPRVSYCDVMGGFDGEGNFDLDPLFVAGPAGDFYLSQIAAGQGADSPCVNAGSDEASSFPQLRGTTTRTDHVADRSRADLGYHVPRS